MPKITNGKTTVEVSEAEARQACQNVNARPWVRVKEEEAPASPEAVELTPEDETPADETPLPEVPLLAILKGLDKANDDLWNENGEVNIPALRIAAGDETISRKEVEAVAPGFKRGS